MQVHRLSGGDDRTFELRVVPRRAAGASRDFLRGPTSPHWGFVGFPPLRSGHAPVILLLSNAAVLQDIRAIGGEMRDREIEATVVPVLDITPRE